MAQDTFFRETAGEHFHRLVHRARLESYTLSGNQRGASAVVHLADFIIRYGIQSGASDIHIEPGDRAIRLRYREDGILYKWPEAIPSLLGAQLTARFKVMGGMDSTQKTRPLDGSIAFPLEDGGHIDIRVSTIPSVYGETTVLRLMNMEETLLTLEELGFSQRNLPYVRELVHRPQGLLILTGPMNSGKTTTLYAALSELNVPTTSLLSLEDPIERKIAGVSQIQINEKAGLDYMAGLRAALRQDAEKILLGEIRDARTAEMAVRIALTGHLLMTSLHASNTISAIYRMLEMDIEPYLLAETLEGIIAQRLIRRLCPHCKREVMDISHSQPRYEAVGCKHCRGGYMGRIALQEVLPMTDEMRELIRNRSARRDIETAARHAGMRTLYEDGAEKARQGLTDMEEVRRVLDGSNFRADRADEST